MAASGKEEAITIRVSQLNQLLNGRSTASDASPLVTKDSLLDALLVLYDECNNDYLMKNQYVSGFIKKYSTTVSELRRLRIKISDFEVKNVIGRGHFGEVQVVREKSSGDVYALKVLRKEDTLAQQNVAFYEEERDIMARSNSTWITQLHYAFQDKHNLYLVMDFHPGGDLLSLLARYDDVFEESMAQFYVSEMVVAIHALHGMGYVHRDIKPENILIDRTGHIKLADFGSACRLNDKNSSVSNMPVGTPDYISPEVLTKMNGPDNRGKFGPECDWWSLGVCAYEMLYGKTPFTDEAGSMVSTYANIMNFQKSLKFPDEADISEYILDLIKCLLTDAKSRLGYEGLVVHRFFASVNFDTIRRTRPPFIPTITSSDDTSNFDEFDRAKPAPSMEDYKKRTEFSGKDLPFVGFTFTKGLNNADRPSLAQEVASPACKSNLERRLTVKSNELKTIKEKCKDLEIKETELERENKSLKTKLNEQEILVNKVTAERDALERDMAHYITENKSLKRFLDVERKERDNMDNKATTLLTEIKEQADMAQKLRDEENELEIEQYKEIIDQLEDERLALNRKINKLEKDMKRYKESHDEAESKISELHQRLVQSKESSKTRVEDFQSVLEKQERDFKKREKELQAKLDKAVTQNFEATEMLQQLRSAKDDVEEQLEGLLRRNSTNETILDQLSDSEERRKSLETQVHKLQMMEKREAQLKEQIREKSDQVKQLAEKILILEDELPKVRAERYEFEERSILVCEENEEKLKQIHDQEQTISMLKSNIKLLEKQVSSMKGDFSSPRKRSKSSRRSGSCQTDDFAPLTPASRRRSGWSQTDTSTPSRGSSGTQTSVIIDEEEEDELNSSVFSHTRSPKQKKRGRCHRTPNRKGRPKRGDYCLNESSFMDVSISQTDMGTSPIKFDTSRRSISRSPRRRRSSSPKKSSRRSISKSPMRVKSYVHHYVEGESDDEHSRNISVTVKVRHQSSEAPLASTECADTFSDDECSDAEVRPVARSPIRTVIRRVKKIESADLDTSDIFDDKEARKRQDEIISDLQQERLYLDDRIKSLVKELEESKESVFQQRIRALDLKHELREKTVDLEKEINELKCKLAQAEKAAADAENTSTASKDKEASLRNQLEKVQKELDSLRLESRRKQAALEETKDELQANVDTLQSKCMKFELKEKEAKKDSEKTNEELKTLRTKCTVISNNELKIKELEASLRRTLDERTKFKLEADRAKDDLAEKKRQLEVQEQRVAQLRALCNELESQIQDYELLNQQYEKKESEWKGKQQTYEKAVEERDDEIEHLHKQIGTEKSARQKAEQKKEEINKLIDTTRITMTTEIDRVKKQASKTKMEKNTLESQITQVEHKASNLEVDKKGLLRQVDALQQENVKLKEELSTMITKVTELKNSNLHLSSELDQAVEQYDAMTAERNGIENQMETYQNKFDHDKYKMESTISQQTKLIDYLQVKVENPPKKKKGLFGTAKREGQPTPIQLRELQHSLEHERDKNSSLRREIMKLREELHQAKTEAARNKYRQANEASYQQYTPRKEHDIPQRNSPKAYVSETVGGYHPAVSALVLTPRAQSTPLNQSIENLASGPSTNKKTVGMHHKIPHRFVTGLNSRATKCSVCLGSIHFVKQAAKCAECNAVCHPKCAASLAHTCGLPNAYAIHFTDVMNRARSLNPAKISVANLKLEMQGWLKVPRAGKQIWERRWIELEDNVLFVYTNSDPDGADALDEFDLCPDNGQVSVHSAVTAAELTTTASSDLPYILKLEFEPETTCWPGRNLYLMASSFSEKQKWVATLEAIANTSGTEEKMKEAKVIGNTILKLSGSRRLDINCSYPLNEKTILLGAEEGLFIMHLEKSSDSRPLIQVEGIESVHMIDSLDVCDVILMVTGKQRDLISLPRRLIATGINKPLETQWPKSIEVVPTYVHDGTTCTTFTLGLTNDGVYMCVATAEKIVLHKYLQEKERFQIKKEVLTSQACSCMYFGQRHIYFGTDRFYKINLTDYSIIEFLDQSDSTLAFAIFGAAQYESFPISVIRVSPPCDHEEFLLCFHEFGVFVDHKGRRSRMTDMKWGDLPLSFAYQAPYLYVIYFNSVQVTEILPRDSEMLQGGKTYINVSNPRYLGPAVSLGAIYVGSIHDNLSEIYAFKGNKLTTSSNKENEYLTYTTPSMKKTATRKKDAVTPLRAVDAVTPLRSVDTNKRTSPTPIRRMSTSPGKRSRKNSGTSTVSLTSDCSEISYTSSDFSEAAAPACVKYTASVTTKIAPATRPKPAVTPKVQGTPGSTRSSKVLAMAKKLEHKLANPDLDESENADASF